MFLFGCHDKNVKSDNEILSQYVNLPKVPFQYSVQEIPSTLDVDLIMQQDNTPNDNHISDWGATLGRVLFYDKLLSKNKTIACASCHKQSRGFSDSAQFSIGFDGGRTKRHSMALANARFRVSGLFFWDGRASSLEHQVLIPIQDSLEMGLHLDDMVNRINDQPYYKILFKKAYGDDKISINRVARALAQFVRSIQSFQSPYDVGRSMHTPTEPFENFSSLENLGKSLFFDVKKGNCAGCHYSDAFVMDVPRNNGLDIWESTGDKDIGYERTTNDALDRGKFIAPSLRNVALRPPYMHDGRFSSLEEVITHYSDNIQWSNSLDEHLKDSNPDKPQRLNLTSIERNALVAFMNALTDEHITTDIRFNNPFY